MAIRRLDDHRWLIRTVALCVDALPDGSLQVTVTV
jgi:hypothetical protein